MKIFINGLITGLFLQLALGPVFFFVLNLAIKRTLFDALIAVAAIAIVDYIYILLAIFGVGKLLEQGKIKLFLLIMSSIVLIIFGVYIIKGGIEINTSSFENMIPSLQSSFFAAFLLTISSPLTIIFWTSIFAAKALEYNYTKNELFLFGISAGLATIIFLGLFIIILSFVRKSIPLEIIRISNITVGIIFIIYGIVRTIKGLRTN